MQHRHQSAKFLLLLVSYSSYSTEYNNEDNKTYIYINSTTVINHNVYIVQLQKQSHLIWYNTLFLYANIRQYSVGKHLI